MQPTKTRPAESLARDEILAAFVQLRTKDEAARFLGDLCTPGEMKAFTERWRVARLLDGGGKTYRQIAEETGASTATVTRVARFLMQEDNEGYRLILDRLNQSGKAS
jgi:TrpR-related protein YerC/YecD